MQNTQTEQNKKKPFASRRDVFIVVSLLLVSAAAFFLWYIFRTPATQVMISVGRGESTQSEIVDLHPDRTIHIDATLPVTLQIEDGRIRFISSVCPVHTCEGFGWLQNEGEWALCAYSDVMVRIVRSE